MKNETNFRTIVPMPHGEFEGIGAFHFSNEERTNSPMFKSLNDFLQAFMHHFYKVNLNILNDRGSETGYFYRLDIELQNDVFLFRPDEVNVPRWLEIESDSKFSIFANDLVSELLHRAYLVASDFVMYFDERNERKDLGYVTQLLEWRKQHDAEMLEKAEAEMNGQ